MNKKRPHIRSRIFGALLLTVSVSVFSCMAALLPHPITQNILRESNRITIPGTSSARLLDLIPVDGFQTGYRYTFHIAYPDSQFAFVTGREYIPFQRATSTTEPKPRPEQIAFAPAVNRDKVAYGVKFVDNSDRYDRNGRNMNGSISLNYQIPPQSFATIDNVARWQEREAGAMRYDLDSHNIRFSIAIEADFISFYANGVFMHRIPAEGIELAECRLRIQRDTVLIDRLDTDKLSERFVEIDISERLNAAGLPKIGGATNLPTQLTVGGVPFNLNRPGRNDHLNLSMSWLEAAMRTGYRPTEVWSRWLAATDKTPLRYQFRIPFAYYDNLYVLAASDASQADSIPRLTAQFYLPRRGRPVNFVSPDIPAFQSEVDVVDSFTLHTRNGNKATLFLVKIPLEPGQFLKFSKSDFVDMELTKDVQTYRAYPDPLTHSIHGAGLPSSVKVFGLTFERSALQTTFTPDTFAGIWQENERASYTVELKNTTDAPIKSSFTFHAASYDGTDIHTSKASKTVAPHSNASLAFRFKPRKFGHYTLDLTKKQAGVEQKFRRTMVHLRKREIGARDFDDGMFYGCWAVRDTDTVRLTGLIGMDGYSGLHPYDKETEKLMEEFGFQDFYGPNIMRIGNHLAGNRDEQEDLAILRERMPPLFERFKTPSPIRKPLYTAILCEPGGIGTGNAELGEYFGEKAFDYRNLEGTHASRYQNYKYQFLTIRKALREIDTDLKVMMPNGSWTFAIPFLQDPDTRNLIDGVKCDFQFYTRLPEQQMHQCSIHSMYYFHETWKRYRPDTEPLLVFGEGPDISPVYPGGSTEELSAAHRIRVSVMMAGYGAHHQHSWATSINQAGGENHCTGGMVENEVTLNPELSYAAFATHTRRTRHARFDSFTNPGSYSAYCANFRDNRDNSRFSIIWNIRGTRDFIFDNSPSEIQVFDAMDNPVKIKRHGKQSLVKVGPMPMYVYGIDGTIALGAVDHSDNQLGPISELLGNAADLLTQQSDDTDDPYMEMMPSFVKRFPVRMEIETQPAPMQQGGKALSVKLEPQKIDRHLMPYFTCLKPKNPIPINGKASHISIWAKGASDWGRIVYVLRDANNKLWYSVGFKGTWNADDMLGDSVFCYDGWRLLRFEMPANAPWDSFRELGMTNWGSEHDKSIVELPLALEKVFVERRSSVMYGNDAYRIKNEEPVLLGDIYVEYAQEEDRGDEVVRLSRIRAPVLSQSSLPNPVKELAEAGTLPPGKIIKVEDPDTWFDGTRGVFTFEMPEEAESADIWLSLEKDGRGALKQGSAIKKSPVQISNFLADTDFHAFLVYRTKDGQISKPSEPFTFRLIDHFGHQ